MNMHRLPSAASSACSHWRRARPLGFVRNAKAVDIRNQRLPRRSKRFRDRIGDSIMFSIKAPDLVDRHVGNRIRMRRLMLRMTQEELAGELGLTFQQVQKYEKGTNRISASRLQHIANVLDVQVPFFFQGAPLLRGQARRSREEPSPAYVTDFLALAEGHALMRAYVRIKNGGVRRAVVRLLEALAASDS
jgi:transcriptional regulator with XRE-family HTH domain